MAANKRSGTQPEIALRSAVHRSGLRFRVDFPIRLPGVRPIRPDIAFPRPMVAVFVDGCFWHGCPIHGTQPKSNQEYWLPKLEGNRARDVATTEALEARGWLVLRFWEHESVEEASQKVDAAVLARRQELPRR